jgi:hypothetical protein
MMNLIGRITARILSGEIPTDAVFPAKRPGAAPPTTAAIKSAKGQGLGKGATRKRSGPGARATED